MNADLDTLWRVIEVQPELPGRIRTHGTGETTASGEILVAVDEVGRRSVLFPVKSGDTIAPDHSTKVHLDMRTLVEAGLELKFVSVSCDVERLSPVFTSLAEDMVRSAAGSQSPIDNVQKVLNEWRDLLSAERMPILPRKKLVGLIGELITLFDVISRDPQRDISVWKGPEEALHDIRAHHHAIEVKGSLVREGLFAQIHGVRQLEPPPNCDLHLFFHRLEEAPDGDITLPSLIRSILALNVHSPDFIDRLNLAGYDLKLEEEYEKLRFRRVETRVFAIDDSFPRIVPNLFAAGVEPAGVLRIAYTVDLTGPVPVPLSPEEVDAVLGAFSDRS